MVDSGMNRVVRHLLQAARGRTGGDLTDGQLLECFVAGRDELAFEALVCRHGPMVLGVCRRVLGQVQDAEDAFQATFLVLLRKGSSVWPRAKVGNWLYGVAYRIALKARAVRHKRQAKEKPLAAAAESAAPSTASLDWLPLLDRELHGLPAKYRVTIVLCDLQGKTQHDAARQLGWREGTLSGRLSRARVLLGRRLTRRGIGLPAAGLAAALSGQAALAAVPHAMTAATVKAASYVALKQAVTAGVISARVAALTEGVLTAMMFSKLKAGFVCVLALALVATGMGQVLYNGAGQVAGAGGAAPTDTVKVPKAAGSSSKAATQTDAMLHARGNFDYVEISLGEALNDLRSKYGINIVLSPSAVPVTDGPALPVADTKVSLQLKDVPLETALRYLLKSAKLGFVNQDGILVITSREKTMIRKVYPVATLLGKDEEKNAQALIQVITISVEPESWWWIGRVQPLLPAAPVGAGVGAPAGLGNGAGNLGGAGAPTAPGPPPENGPYPKADGASITYFPGTKALVVLQSHEAQREIEDLLHKLAEK